MELTVDGIQFIINVEPAGSDGVPEIVAKVKGLTIEYRHKFLALYKGIDATAEVYTYMRDIITNNDKHLLTAVFNDSYCSELLVTLTFIKENETNQYRFTCRNVGNTWKFIKETVDSNKRAAELIEIKEQNIKLLKCMETLTERITALETRIK